ncbi:NAD(P)/FAD-dependent oxidoreductase [Pseudomonas zhanjiangensis]|uniref:NAD(P)/FAD-dependent oxidoreductase n=1 Tax=Pseudomonas zhanjiangensis TaxID=3239015 RepID=A0ABV3YWU1_9PSED
MTAYFNYYETTVERRAFTQLEGHHSTDVCIIGGGLTGVSSALGLAEAGIASTLLEARCIGGCASGMNGGQVIRGFAPRIQEIEAAYGMDLSIQLFKLADRGLTRVFDNVERFGIACDMRRGGLTAAIRPAHFPALMRDAEHLAALYDYPCLRPVAPAQLADYVDSPRYHGGLYDPRGGQLNPLAYVLGLAHAASRLGAQLHEYSPALHLQQRDGRWLIKTRKGSLSAERVIFASNAFTADIERALAPAILKVGTYQLATRPLSAQEAAAVGTAAVFDTHPFNHYFRKTPDQRLLFGCSIGTRQGPRPGDLRHIRRELGKLFPSLAGVEIDYVWGGWMDITANHLPDIRETRDGRIVLQGFNGHGLNTTAMAADLAVAKLQGQAQAFAPFAAIRHRALPGLPWSRLPLTWAGHIQYYLNAHLAGDRMDFA